MSFKEKLKKIVGDTIETNIQAIRFNNNFYYVNFVDFDTEEFFCFDGANEEEGSNFFVFTFDELEKDSNLKLFALKELKYKKD